MKKKRKPSRRIRKTNDAIAQAASRAANRHTPIFTTEVIPGLKRAQKRAPKRVLDLFNDMPKQRMLFPKQRGVTTKALSHSKGKPLNRTQRRAAAARVPEELRRIICGERKARRQVLHAKKLTTKGAASRQRELTWRSEVRC